MTDAPWIKMRTNLGHSPQVVRLASAFNADKCPLPVRLLAAVGALHATWSLFDSHAAHGFLEGYTLEALDLVVGVAGWGAAMVEVGWLVVSPGGVGVYAWEQHNGTSAKRRAQEASRKRAVRSRAGQKSASDADKCPDAMRPPSISISSVVLQSEEASEEEQVSGALSGARVRRQVAKSLEPVDDRVVEALDRWARARAEIGKPLSASSVRKLLVVGQGDPEAFVRRVEASIEHGTTVLLEDGPRGGGSSRQAQHQSDLQALASALGAVAPKKDLPA